ncbi:MAG: hypothetical protein K2J78_00140, partial [Muribaculaceae bacterium]|nr:hypothetical protein [Muribaculaceae bacterium]
YVYKRNNTDTDNINRGNSQNSYQKKTAQNPNFQDDGRNACKYPEENAFNHPGNTHQNISTQQINSYINSAGLISEIENLRSKIKKVIQITIYYDDSTFEAFYPK